MRGKDEQSGSLFSYVSCEARVPADHPLRLIRAVVDEALDVLSGEFDGLYARFGRPGIAPEKLLRALLLQAFYSIRSERQLMEQLDYNLLFRWFVGLSMDAPVWDASTFSKNRERLLAGDVAQRLLAAVVGQPRVKALMSNEHFSVDGTLIQAWASHKSFQPKAGPGDEPPALGGSSLNWDDYCNPEVDKMIELQSREPDEQKRRQQAWAIERNLAEDAERPIIFYASAASCWQPTVKGLTLMVNSVLNSYRYEDIWLDK